LASRYEEKDAQYFQSKIRRRPEVGGK
jgi:hypothetical protein